MRVLVCGSRTYGATETQRVEMMALLDAWIGVDYTVVHGAAPGADSLAEEWARGRCVATEPYPADWDQHGKAAGPIRNQQMLDSGIDLCLAFTDKPLRESRGTNDMVTRCRQASVMTVVMEVG